MDWTTPPLVIAWGMLALAVIAYGVLFAKFWRLHRQAKERRRRHAEWVVRYRQETEEILRKIHEGGT